MSAKAVARIIPTIQAAALVGENLRVAKKKKKSVGDITGLGLKNIVGTGLIKMQSDLIESI